MEKKSNREQIRRKFEAFLDSINFTSIVHTQYTWEELSKKWSIPSRTLRRWADVWKRKSSGEYVPRKKWEMYTKQGIVELHSYEHTGAYEVIDIIDSYDWKSLAISVKEYLDKIKDRGKDSGKGNEVGKDVSHICVLIGDVHIGMDTSDNIFGFKWTMKEVMRRADTVVEVLSSTITTNAQVHLVFGGDIVDGQDGMTTRRRHALPQNMDNRQQIDNACKFITSLIMAISTIDTVSALRVHYISNSNHGGILEYAVGRVVEQICSAIDIQFNLYTDFLTNIKVRDSIITITHGYDEKYMNRGFGRFLNKNQLDLVKKFSKQSFPILLRFDQHQYHHILYDNFIDILVPSFAPPSAYITLNYGADYKGGFVLYDASTKATTLVSF